MAPFVDRLGGQTESYAAARPTYPVELFAFLAEESPAHISAWDCATGKGQAASWAEPNPLPEGFQSTVQLSDIGWPEDARTVPTGAPTFVPVPEGYAAVG